MKSKSVLITGGSRGLGYAMAVAMSNQGHRVAITGRNEAKLKEAVRDCRGVWLFMLTWLTPGRQSLSSRR